MPYKNPERVRENRRQLYAANPEGQRERTRRWKAANPASRRATARRWKLAQYGLTLADWERLWSEQEGYCALCLRPLVRDRTTAVDHDAMTGTVRGLLHQQCNIAIGMLDHDSMRVRLALTYLDRHVREGVGEETGGVR